MTGKSRTGSVVQEDGRPVGGVPGSPLDKTKVDVCLNQIGCARIRPEEKLRESMGAQRFGLTKVRARETVGPMHQSGVERNGAEPPSLTLLIIPRKNASHSKPRLS